MTFLVTVSPIAKADADAIFAWLHSLSPSGATAWLDAFQSAIKELETLAMQHARATEGNRLGRNVREKLFKTRQGRPYRLLYSVKESDVRILRIRGPGQPPVRRRDLK